MRARPICDAPALAERHAPVCDAHVPAVPWRKRRGEIALQSTWQAHLLFVKRTGPLRLPSDVGYQHRGRLDAELMSTGLEVRAADDPIANSFSQRPKVRQQPGVGVHNQCVPREPNRGLQLAADEPPGQGSRATVIESGHCGMCSYKHMMCM